MTIVSNAEPGCTWAEAQHESHMQKRTNTGNAKMLMPTFTTGCEVGLFKQWEVCKVKTGITHSQCAAEVHTSVEQQQKTAQHHSRQQHDRRELLSLDGLPTRKLLSSTNTELKINSTKASTRGNMQWISAQFDVRTIFVIAQQMAWKQMVWSVMRRVHWRVSFSFRITF